MASAARVVFVAVPRGAKAESLARRIVKARLAACVNLLPGVSHYRWKGKLHRDAETLMLIKTSSAKLPALKKWVRENHPYDVPEFLVVNVAAGAANYLSWLRDQVR